MNWTTETFGSNILDFLMFDDYDTANDLINMALGEDYIAEKHGAAGRRRGTNSMPGKEILVQLSLIKYLLCPKDELKMFIPSIQYRLQQELPVIPWQRLSRDRREWAYPSILV